MVAEPQTTARAEAPAGRLYPPPAEKKRQDEAPEQLQPTADNNAPARSIAAPTTTQLRRAAPADGFGALGGLTKGGGAARSGRAKAPASDGSSFEDDKALAPPSTPKPTKREFAPPPPPPAEPSRPSTPAATQMRERDTEAEALEETVAPPRGSGGHLAAGAAPPAVQAQAKAKAKKAEMPSQIDDLDRGTAASAPAPAAAPPAEATEVRKADAKSETRAESKPVAESPVARADRLFAQGQWAAAARSYRNLLRRDPRNGDAARWRRRLAASEEAASARAPAAASPSSRGR